MSTLNLRCDKKRTVTHFVYGFLFCIVSLFSATMLVLIFSQADDTTQTVTVSNATPAVDSITIAGTSYNATPLSSITLTEATTTTVYIWGYASDANGCEEIDQGAQFTLKFFAASTTDACTPDNNDCYSATSATVDQCSAGGGDTTTRYQFPINLQYWANDNTWTAKVTVTDDASAAANSTTTKTVNQLIALDVTSSINYGSMALGATSSSDQTVVVTNTGNEIMSANIKATDDMTCTGRGTILKGNTHYSSSPGFAYASGNVVTASNAATGDVAERTSEVAASTSSIYFKISIPETGIAGVCSNTITWTAGASS